MKWYKVRSSRWMERWLAEGHSLSEISQWQKAREQIFAEIVAKYSNGARMGDLALEYMQTLTTIRRWIRDEHLRMVSGRYPGCEPTADQLSDWSRKPGGGKPRKSLVSPDVIAAILADNSGLSQRKLAAKYGISHQQVRTILRNK